MCTGFGFYSAFYTPVLLAGCFQAGGFLQTKMLLKMPSGSERRGGEGSMLGPGWRLEKYEWEIQHSGHKVAPFLPGTLLRVSVK